MQLNFHTRLLVSLLVIFFTVFSILGAVLITSTNTKIEQLREAQAQNLAKALAKGSIDALIAEDYVQMERWVESSLPSTDFAYAALVRTNGQVLSHSNQDYVAKKIQTATTGTHGTTQSTYYQRQLYPAHFHIKPATECAHYKYGSAAA